MGNESGDILGAFLKSPQYNDFRKALVRIVLDQAYVGAMKMDPTKLAHDYRLSDEELDLIEDVIKHAIPEIRKITSEEPIALHSVVFAWDVPLFPGAGYVFRNPGGGGPTA